MRRLQPGAALLLSLLWEVRLRDPAAAGVRCGGQGDIVRLPATRG